MNFQLSIGDQLPFMKRIIIKFSYSGALMGYNFVWNVDIF